MTKQLQGLSNKEAHQRLKEFGENVLVTKKKQSRLFLFIKNFNSPLIYILFLVALITLVMGKFIDATVILTITLINATLGYIQETKAEQALEALKKMTQAFCVVIRDGEKHKIPSSQVVQGDIIYLEEGDKIPADCKIIKQNNLNVDEAVLTGESFPVEKKEDEEVFMGTTVVSGNAYVEVVKTAMNTEFGKISKLADEGSSTKTPLQIKMAAFSKKLGLSIVLICILVFMLGTLFGQSILEMFSVSISLAVSAIPEGLPVAITVVLVLGVNRMVKKRAIVRNLNAVETLGTTTVIATDKTGTLTHNKMTVIEVFTDNFYSVSGDGYGLNGYFHVDRIKIDPKKHLRLLLTAGVLANNGEIVEKNGRTEIIGDPTDCAVLVAAHKGGVDKKSLAESAIRLDEIPFNSNNKYTAVLVDEGGAKMTYIKGALEEVIKRSTHVYDPEKNNYPQMTLKEAQRISSAAAEMTSKGLRVIALGYKEDGYRKDELTEKDIDAGGFVFVGLIGMRDTYRKGVKEAIENCQRAGIKVVMLTGDHLETAMIIGRELNILTDETQAMNAQKFEEMDINEVRKIVNNVTVFARISPASKFKIITALKLNGEIVAMTGDGVNDVPALKKADIGVAMGVMGTEAAKEAGDMVLTDDNFSTIFAAVGEGRTVYENIRKVIYYLLSTSLGEVIVVITGIISGFGVVILPLQIIWVNMITDTAVTIPLGMEPDSEDRSTDPPRKTSEGILNNIIIFRILLASITMAIIAITIYRSYLPFSREYANTMLFLTIVIIQWFNALNAKNEYTSLLKTKVFQNKALIVGLLIAVTGQVLVMSLPPVREVFRLVEISPLDWLRAISSAAVIILVIEIQKLVFRWLKKRSI